jgi:hypothetical protein
MQNMLKRDRIFYAALQNWSKVGDGSDSKLGIGGGGMVGIALSFDSSMTFSAGPHFSYTSWTADYSKKSQSFTETVVLNLQDAGVEISLSLMTSECIWVPAHPKWNTT